MRRILTFLLFATTTVGLAQDLNKPVDYTTRAVPLRKVLADLSKQTGKHLVCSPELDEEPLILRVKQVPLKEVMDKIAEVFAGEWVDIERGLNLVRSKRAERMHKDELALRAREFTKQVDAVLESAPKPWDPTSIEPLLKAMGTDISRLMREHSKQDQALVAAICNKIDPASVVDQIEGQRTVFSTDPTALQRALPDMDEALDKFLENREFEARAIQESNLDRAAKQRALEMIGDFRAPATMVFSLTRVRESDFIGELDLYDVNGTRTASYVGSIGPRWNYRDYWNDEQKLRQATKKGIGFSPETLEIWLHARPGDESMRPLSPKVREILLTPTQYDPLAFACSDAVLGLAEQENLNAIYLPSDYGEGWGYLTCRNGKGTLELFQKVLHRARDAEAVVENGWLTVRPYDPLDAARTRMSRTAMEKFEHEVDAKRAILFDDKAELALAGSPSTEMVLASNNASALASTEDFYLADLSTWSITAFWATLDEKQRKAARQGTLRFGPRDLDQRQTELIESWVLNRSGPMEYVAPVKSGPPPTPTLAAEPSIALADGLPVGSFLEIIESIGPMFDIPIVERDTAGRYGMEMLADMVAHQDRPDLTQNSAKYELGSITRLEYHRVNIRLLLPSGYGCAFPMEEVTGKGKPQRLADLIKAFSPAEREEWDRMLANARRDVSKLPVQPMNPPSRS